LLAEAKTGEARTTMGESLKDLHQQLEPTEPEQTKALTKVKLIQDILFR
jgi:hypothetical protein